MGKLKYLVFLLISIPIFAQSGQVSNIALQNASGYAQVKPGTNVYVCAYNSGLTCVTPTNEISIYANPSLSGGPIGQPLIADQSGRYNYFLPSGIEGVEKDCYTAGQCVTYPVWGGTAAGSGSFTYPPAGIPDSSGISWNSSFGIIGTDTSILTAGTVAGGAGTSICLDVNGGLTTTGCSSISGTIGVIPVFLTSNSIGDSPLDTTSLSGSVSDSQNFRLRSLGTATSSQNFGSNDLIVDGSGWNTGLTLVNNCASCAAYTAGQIYTATISGETCSVNPSAVAVGANSGSLNVNLSNPGSGCTVSGIITVTGSPGTGYSGTLTVANSAQIDRWTILDQYIGTNPAMNTLTLFSPGHRSSSNAYEFCMENQPLQGAQSAHCLLYDGQAGGQLNESISEITAARVASWVNASGDIALFTHGSPVNGDCVEFSVTGGVATLADNGAPCGSGSGAVNSVANSDGTLVISPTTGSVVASLNLAHANTWTGLQTLVGTDITGLPLSTGVTGTLSATNGGTGEAGTLTGILYGNATSAHTVASAAQLGTLFNSYISTLTGCSTANFVYTPAGNDCVAVSSGSGTVNSGTAGQITWYATTGTAVSGNANATLDSSGDATFGGTVTVGGTGTTHGLSVTEGTAWTPVTGQDILEAISSNHRFEMSLNGAAALLIPGIASAGTANDCLKLASNGIDIVDTGAACASGSVSFSAITSGTSTTGLVMGSSGVLSFSGTGIINANEINAVLLSSLATGLLKNTNTTGVPTIATAGTDYLLPTGSATGLSKASSSAFGVSECDGTTITCSGGIFTAVSSSIANITISVTGATQGANSCSSPATATQTGVTTSGAGSHVTGSYTANPTSLTGWGSTGGMVFQVWPSASNTDSWIVCNQTTSSITYSSVVFSIGAQ